MKISCYSLVLLFSLALWGCSSSNSSAPTVIDTTTGKHPAGWAVNGTGGTHPFAYFANPTSCEECHGKPSDPAGGISRVSCSNPGRSGVACHPSFPHAVGFSAFAKHGSAAKDVASGITGMAHCKQCHGSSYTGTVTAPSCIACHKVTTPSSNAPHAANWVSGNANGLKHSSTDTSNAPACAQCHLGGTYSHQPPVPAPAGTAPGCFNGTLCHNNAGHALPYVTGHQADAKANLASCQPCHATPASGANPRFNLLRGTGVLNPNGCEGCHNKAGIAHPSMWLPGRGTTNGATNATSHTTAGTVNVSCGLCHGGIALAGGGSAPSCFPASSINGTTCHFSKPVDAAGITVGCVSCHGSPPNGTVAPNRDYRHTNHFTNIASITCPTCHAGYGNGTTTHATKIVFSSMTAPTAINPLFNENGLTASYSSSTGKCTNVSCHGGTDVNFPAWKSAIPFLPNDPNRCAFYCHTISTVAPAAYTGPYIGPFSGGNTTSLGNLHNFHANALGTASLCARCHATPGAEHWQNIMTGKKTLTVAGTITGTGIVSYSSNSCVTISTGCHADAPVPRAWN